MCIAVKALWTSQYSRNFLFLLRLPSDQSVSVCLSVMKCAWVLALWNETLLRGLNACCVSKLCILLQINFSALKFQLFMLFEVIFVVSLRVFYKFFEASRRFAFSIDSDSDVQYPLITNIQTLLYKRDEYLGRSFIDCDAVYFCVWLWTFRWHMFATSSA
jgi:hypothetical protein